jgi:DNA-binding PadR family transcriptional regulator
MRKRAEDPRKPLSLPVVHILLTLADGARHGYAIKQDVEERTKIRLGPGTLYEAIQRLLDGGLIEEGAADNEPANGQVAQRRYYALTPRGWDVLRDELRRLDAILDHARANPRLRGACRAEAQREGGLV